VNVLDYALRYINRGWPVFPLHSMEGRGGKLVCTCGNESCTDAGKHPRTDHGFKEASTDPEQIRRWFGPDAPPSNIGMVTGEVSGITVLDIDVGAGKQGAQTWRELNGDHGEPVTLVQRTGSGGCHFVFKYNSALNTSTNTLGPGVDVRNDKGFIVVAPSLHRSGARYAWDNDLDTTEIAHLPKHLSKRRAAGRPRYDDPTRKKYAPEQVAEMLSFVSADDRDRWLNVGVILGRTFNRSDEAWTTYTRWADKWGGVKGRNHDAQMHTAFYETSQIPGDLSLGTIIELAKQGGWVPRRGAVSIDQFLYIAASNKYRYQPTGEDWPAESVDFACSQVNENGTLVNASTWLRQHRLITSITLDPSVSDEITKDVDCRGGTLVPAPGAAMLNIYRRATIELGDAAQAMPFVNHVERIFNKPGDAAMFLDFMAHKVQCPGAKLRFALLIAGEQGTGKDTALSMCYPAIGPWNVANIDAAALDQSFNEYEAASLIVISEAANHGEMSKWAFNEKTKVLIAGLPDEVTINPKYGHKFSMRRHAGVVVTTNHMEGGLYIPPDDRRYDVIEAATKKEMGLEDAQVCADYFNTLWGWFHASNGASHVAAFLKSRDIAKFNPNTGQRKTAAHRLVVACGLQGDDVFADALAALKDPPLVRMDALFAAIEVQRPGDMTRAEFSAKANHSMRRLGYRRLINSEWKDGRWKATTRDGQECRVVVYVNVDKCDKEALDHVLDGLKNLNF
jgi:hypothetical protein